LLYGASSDIQVNTTGIDKISSIIERSDGSQLNNTIEFKYNQ